MNPLLLPVSPQNLVLSARKVFWAKVGGFVSLNDKQICIVLATAHCSYLHLYLECKVYRPLQALCYIWIWIYLWLGKINAHRSVCFSVFRVFFWALCKCLVLCGLMSGSDLHRSQPPRGLRLSWICILSLYMYLTDIILRIHTAKRYDI